MTAALCTECRDSGVVFYGSALGVLLCRVCRLAAYLQARDLLDDPLPPPRGYDGHP